MKGTHATDYCTPDLRLPESFLGERPAHENHKRQLKTIKKSLIFEAVVFSRFRLINRGWKVQCCSFLWKPANSARDEVENYYKMKSLGCFILQIWPTESPSLGLTGFSHRPTIYLLKFHTTCLHITWSRSISMWFVVAHWESTCL